MNKSIYKIVVFVFLLLLALGERILFDLGSNIELITVGMLILTFYFDIKWGLVFVVLTMIVSDIAIGNTSIYLFTWTGFLIPVMFASFMLNNQQSIINNSIRGTMAGIGATLFFFVWTNFGVWLLDSWNMYPNTLAGLTQSYVNALPFLRYHLTSTLLFVPMGFAAVEIVKVISNKYLKVKNTNQALGTVRK